MTKIKVQKSLNFEAFSFFFGGGAYLFLLLFSLFQKMDFKRFCCDLCLRVFCLVHVFLQQFYSVQLTFRSLIHFELIFVYAVKECFYFILLHVAVQFSQNYLLKRLSFLYCVVLPPFQQITIYEPPYIGVCVYLWIFYPVPLIYISFCASTILQ